MCVMLLAYVNSEGCVHYISLQWTGMSCVVLLMLTVKDVFSTYHYSGQECHNV